MESLEYGSVWKSTFTRDKSTCHPSAETSGVDNAHELYKKGDVVEAVVLNVDPSAERFSLGLKQMTDDPWDLASQKYEVGTEIECQIIIITDFGLFVKVAGSLLRVAA